MDRIPVLSFFSGGGFLDIGFEMAGFDIIWTNEIERNYAEIYDFGLTSWRNSLPQAPCSKPRMNLQSIEKLSKAIIVQEAFGSVSPDFFGVIGGPPCQDFTSSGHNKGREGERGRQTQNYADMICQLKPHFFLMENVPGLYKKKHRHYFDHIVKQLESSKPGYLTSSRILSALEMGIPQNRDRLFLIGFRKDLVQDELARSLLLGKNHDWFDWPILRFPDAKNFTWPQTNRFLEQNVVYPTGIPRQLTVNDLLKDDAELLPNGKDVFTPHSDKFSLIDEGDVSGKSFKRLHRYRYSPTVWYGNNEVHLHPWKPRRLTVRESLRIQTVPDGYAMPTTSSLTDKFRVISNGVPTRMAQQVGEAILVYIRKKSLSPMPVKISS